MMKWLELPFNRVAEVVTGNTPPRTEKESYSSAGIPWVKPPDLDSDEPITKTAEYLSDTGKLKARILPKGSVMVCCIGTIGKVGIAGCEVATNQQINSLIFNKMVDPKYGYYYCKANNFLFQSVAPKAVVPILKKSIFEKIKITLPSPSEQRRIVEILEQADEIRKLRKQADEKAEKIIPALFYKMFGEPLTNPRNFKKIELGKLLVEKPKYGANASSIPYKDGTPRYIRITDINDFGELGSEKVGVVDSNWKEYALKWGDLLFARSGATVGKTYLYKPEDGDCVFAGYLIKYSLNKNKINPWFAFYLTKTEYYQSWKNSKMRIAAQPNINSKEYSSLLIPLPNKEEQDIFASRALILREIIMKNNLASEKINLLYETLISKAFDGSLTASWREAHMKELLKEMEEQKNI